MTVIEQMLQNYAFLTDEDKTRALREVMQKIALAGLHRSGFFSKAAFYGGTCLRIFYGLPRFSEDLDFSLLRSDTNFVFNPYFNALKNEFAAFGFDIEIVQKNKTTVTPIASAFLKKNSSIYDLQVLGQKVMKIKFEVDTDPPLGFTTQEKLLVQPYSFYVKCFSLPDLFAGKIHAVLYRKWQNRVKGRDWFDFEWYVRRACELNLSHFCERARQSGDLTSASLQPTELGDILQARILSLDVNLARQDIVRFISDTTSLNIWSQEYFAQIVSMIRYQALKQ